MTEVTEFELKTLMLLSLDGDEIAYRRLLDGLRRLLTSYYGRRLGGRDRTDVDDLLQETLLALHQRRMTYDRARPFTAWFFTIARHKLVDHYRRTGGQMPVGLEMAENIPDGYSEDAVAAGMDVHRLLAGLPAWQGEVIRQVRIDGQSIAEAATLSGRSETMVKVSIHRGIRTLAARMRGERGEDG